MPADSRSVSFETVSCPLGHTTPSTPLYDFSDSYGNSTIVRCSDCGFSFLSPRPTAQTIGVYYDTKTYTPFLSSANRRTFFSRLYSVVRMLSVRWKRRQIEATRQEGSVLDVGCGTGEFLHEMATHGWLAAGIEPSAEASSYARRKYHLEIKTGSIGSGTLREWENRFDVITAWHVLEHVHDLHDALSALVCSLKRNGLIVLGVPNIASHDARSYGRDWVALDPPRHVWHFTPATMRRLLEGAGLTLERQRAMPLDTWFNVLMTERALVQSRGWWFGPIALGRALARIAVSSWCGLRGNGSSMMYFARKN